ncbi:DNA excision repair protein ERCC-6-like 2 [Fulvia fulva]|uniref:DNA excision repair protein ERCC-6-like 2 n=1 Tax=Passalora fulva TaxID=5499 RepID=A0A9Q8P7V1_PASFU|nr:DNA excision repair protein ERCC-6-like 2 [Fulvia fulva]KAK4627122.1 DNA excision repair protein ERCC-6-like 2 [Fulvia fulva]KAK4628179.1 DNA excision repair protein ERCC-6-like 2 [Fulvia fulva]UJO16262.1 DNA excision repair protein ERCC-6-like 2 [Fulvia fulva]WPV14086.1 DNA excision repair protein ERCC-6-like 2 [Fulvia fulva]WPV28537.1 DNA excision repair protein ERCC-6-like 2 [Fulvia fulva]
MAARWLGHRSSEMDTDSDDLHIISSGPATKSSSRVPSGERVEWTDDDEPAPVKSKSKTKSNSKPKQRREKQSREPPKKRTKTTGKSMVGRKATSTKRKITSSGEEEDDTLDDILPQYLCDRAAEWETHLGATAEDGLCYPPRLRDEESQRTHLDTRPVLPDHIPKSGPCEPIDIGDDASTIPGPIAQYLKPYQVDGADFLYKKFLYQKGGILGDDMGLGKTIQVIAFLTAAFGKSANEMDQKRMRAIRRQADDDWYPRVLIVCPGGLMANWRNELERWGYWHVDTYHGGKKVKEAALATAHSGRLEIMITPYQTYTNDESAINTIRWDCVIADECHMFKNRRSDVCKAMMNVNALCRIGLSGTVIQNKYEELWVLLNWCSPGRLGPMINWKNKICIPLKMGQAHGATNTQLATARNIAERLVKNLLPKFFLRRTKALIAHQLPKKSDRVVFCPLTPAQADAYNNFTASELVTVIRDATSPCTCNSGRKSGWCCNQEVEGWGDWRFFVFPVLVTLQKLSNHLALLLPSGESDHERMAKDIATLKLAVGENEWEDYFKRRDETTYWAKAEFCGKWKVLKKLLHLWDDNGDKVLIFSHSVKLLRLLHMFFKVTSEFVVSYLTGEMSYDERQAEVDLYNTDPNKFIFLISTKAGGVGLNITSANKVVIMDPNWNPAWDQQAQDRAYRMGQLRDVDVFRLVSVGTVEEIVYARQIYKQQQANIAYDGSNERRYFTGVQDQKNQKGEIFGLANLFAPMAENVVLQDIVNKTNVAESRAGVEIAGLDLEASQEDDGRELSPLGDMDAAMDELAQEIIGHGEARRKAAKETAKQLDPVQAIFASAGVEYTHENTEVIGTSKMETKISSRAQKAGDDIDRINELAFGAIDSQSQLDMAKASDDGIDLGDGLGRVRYRYRPPQEVRVRQFCTMAKQFGYEDVAEFALVVEGWDQGQRRDCLERFYLDRRRTLAESQQA